MDEIELQFDAMEQNTDLAKEYINIHKGRFYPLGVDGSKEEFILDNANNKLFKLLLDKPNVSDTEEPYIVEGTPCGINTAVFEKLAYKIEENSELFAQLEALIRSKRKEEVINWDIQLIVQNLLYHSAHNSTCSYPGAHLKIFENSPLANLGYVAEKVLRYNPVCIIAAPNTGVVCHLFTALCHEVGLTQVKLNFEESNANEHEPTRGCVGVITAQSDIDSAVDILLSSSTQYPWKVERIFVQESVYDTVRKIFRAKCDLKTVNPKFKTSFTDSMTYEAKLIIFDGVANEIKTEAVEENIILVEAYRTAKELISLVNKQKPFCISLWSSNVAEADEIAFSVDAQIVWINEFGSFWGPLESSQAFYSFKSRFYSVEMNSDLEKLLKLRDAWQKIDFKSRKALVKEVIAVCEGHEGESICKERVLKLIRKKTSEKEMFIETQRNRMCIGARQLSDVLLHVKDDIEEAITYLISGKAVIVSDLSPFKDPWFKELAGKGLPVVFDPQLLRLTDKCDKAGYLTCFASTKVVYKNFGTIFAN